MSQIGCPYEPKFVGNASRVYPIDQKYRAGVKPRISQKHTRSSLIALEEHRQWHIENGTFESLEELDLHQLIMSEAMLEGASFMEAHQFAIDLVKTL